MPAHTEPRRTLRDEQKLRTRERILEAANTLFVQRGYGAVRVDDVAAAVGCSRATFYLHFTGKMAVLRELGERTALPSALAFCEDLDRVLETGSRAEFEDWMRRAIDWFEQHRDLLSAWDEATALEPEFRDLMRAGFAALPESMTAYLARWPAERRDEARLRVEMLVAQLERFFTRWALLGTIDVTADRAAAVLADIWFPALQTP
ncbi:TetR/AcrR family transcriptional regulator [Nocardia harenae]|uniref:TetR/AcrR family transcriptional regulator n=1 Tax=Nocardia harenae TaxID=358707 RepID=UPI00082BBA74|nr:TetR/AcrR family transcriptional regulator [Nocardia harenae]